MTSLIMKGLKAATGVGHLINASLRPVNHALLFPIYGCCCSKAQIAESVKDKTVVITGCDTGFGNLLAVDLDRMGVPVIAACYTSEGCESLAQKCSSKLKTVVCDVTKDDSVQNLKVFVEKNAPNGVWGVINNAGIYDDGPLDMISVKEFQSTLGVNFFGSVRVSLALLPIVRKTPGSRMIFVASVAGFLSTPTMTAYCCSKHAIEAFGDAMRKLLLPEGVHVSIIEPGFMKTPIVSGTRAVLQKKFDAASKEVQKRYGASWPAEVEKMSAELYNCAQDPMLVIDDMMHALWSRFPQTRYNSGIDSKFLRLVTWATPTWIQDRYLLLIMNARRKAAKSS